MQTTVPPAAPLPTIAPVSADLVIGFDAYLVVLGVSRSVLRAARVPS